MIRLIINELISVFGKLKVYIQDYYKSVLITSILWIICYILMTSSLYNPNKAYKEFITTTSDTLSVLLEVQTDSKYSTDELRDKFKTYSLAGIEEVLKNEEDANSLFKSSFIVVTPYTTKIASSFDKGKYKPIYREPSIFDKALTSKMFIKDRGLSEEYINYVTQLTKNGESSVRASFLYELRKEYNNGNN